MNTYRACMTIAKEIELGTEQDFEIAGSPDTFFTPEELIHNITCPMFVYMGNLSIAGQHLLIGGGFSDLSNLNLDFPHKFEITPAMSIKIMIRYLGYIPIGFSKGQKVIVSFTFKGEGRWE